MSLKDVKKELEEQIEEAKKREAEADNIALKEAEGKIEEAVKDPDAKEEPKAVEKPEEKANDKPEEKPEEKTATGYAKDRQARKDKLASDLAAANARIAALEASVKSVPSSEKTTSSPEPDPNTNPTGWMAWKLQEQEKRIEHLTGWKAEQDVVRQRESLMQQAQREVEGFEAQVRQANPDYDDVKNFYGSMMAQSIKIVNPKLSQKQVVDLVNNRLLSRASELLNEGYENPIEAMYLEAKSLGYQPKQAEKETKEEPKPDMDKVANFRKRNAGMAAGTGSGGEADVTAKVAAGMTNAEFSKLKPEQKKKLFNSLRSA